MTAILFNIAYYYIDRVCWIGGFNPLNIRCGQMGVLLNSKAKPHGILLIDTHI
jgi:hypothetical protein